MILLLLRAPSDVAAMTVAGIAIPCYVTTPTMAWSLAIDDVIEGGGGPQLSTLMLMFVLMKWCSLEIKIL
jgi:hypothetical protein